MWHFNHMYCDGSKASQVFDQGMLLPAVFPMQTVPGSWERCWTMIRHWGFRAGGSHTSLAHRAPGTAAVLPWCYSKYPMGVQHPLSRVSAAWTSEGVSKAQDVSRMEPFTAAKLSPWQEKNRHQNMQQKVDNPHKPLFFEHSP